MTDPELLTAGELRVRLGFGKTQFFEYQRLGRWKFLETKRPIGQRRYAKALVDRYVAGESVSQFGSRAV